jgi:hypothetical protein
MRNRTPRFATVQELYPNLFKGPSSEMVARNNEDGGRSRRRDQLSRRERGGYELIGWALKKLWAQMPGLMDKAKPQQKAGALKR